MCFADMICCFAVSCLFVSRYGGFAILALRLAVFLSSLYPACLFVCVFGRVACISWFLLR